MFWKTCFKIFDNVIDLDLNIVLFKKPYIETLEKLSNK